MALVIAWLRDAPHRAGEVAVLAKSSEPQILGRGEGTDGEPQLRWFRQRPGAIEDAGPLTSVGLSRKQLLVELTDDGIRLERLGRSSLFVNGVRTDARLVRPCDVVRIGGELILYVASRPALLPTPRFYPRATWRAFGEADAAGILGESPATWRLRDHLAFAGKADTHLLLIGPSGSGKELAARAVHALSLRSTRPFVSRNAATLPAGLIDAELFGNARNYPNPGMAERAGLIGDSDSGMLFLDEIGELPAELQAHLLRVLDAGGEYQRLGESLLRRSNLRLIAATNRDESALKHDFLARFSARIELPSLDARREDIPLLARGLLLRAAERSPEIVSPFIYESEHGREEVRFAPELIETLLQRSYPTNVRELDALLWRALAESDGNCLTLAPDSTTTRSSQPAERRSTPTSRPEPTADEIRAALASNSGNIPAASRALGLSSRFALNRLIKKLDIEPASKKREDA